jgi:hypothetical protein
MPVMMGMENVQQHESTSIHDALRQFIHTLKHFALQ